MTSAPMAAPGEAFADARDAAGVVLGAIPAVHSGEDTVGAGLQRHMKMTGEAVGTGKEINEFARDVQRLDGARAEALERGAFEDLPEKIHEFEAGSEVAAVGAEINAAQDDFLVAGGDEAANFAEDFLRGQAAAASADEGNHAVGAAMAATILDLQRGARASGCVAAHRDWAAQDRRGEHAGLLEDIACENLRWRVRRGHDAGREAGKRNERRRDFLGCGGRSDAADEVGDLRLVRVADHPGDARQRGELFGGALGVTAGDHNARGGILSAEVANGRAGLRVGGSGDRAGVHDDDIGGDGSG